MKEKIIITVRKENNGGTMNSFLEFCFMNNEERKEYKLISKNQILKLKLDLENKFGRWIILHYSKSYDINRLNVYDVNDRLIISIINGFGTNSDSHTFEVLEWNKNNPKYFRTNTYVKNVLFDYFNNKCITRIEKEE